MTKIAKEKHNKEKMTDRSAKKSVATEIQSCQLKVIWVFTTLCKRQEADLTGWAGLHWAQRAPR